MPSPGFCAASGARTWLGTWKFSHTAICVSVRRSIVVAAFNIISSLIMLVAEKSREIAILKSLGATDGSVRRIFVYQGVVIGLAGTLFGVFLGLGLCWILGTFNIIDIPPGVYPGGNRIPVLIDWYDVGLTTLCSFLICVLVTLYPSSKAARMNPVDPLRYE